MAEQQDATTRTPKPKSNAGRPTKLTRELVDKAATYVDQCFNEVPTKEGLSLYLGIDRTIMYDWAENASTPLGKEFTNIFNSVMAEQAKRIINGALYGRFNATFSALMMSKHGYVKEVHQDHTTNGKDLPVPILGGATQEKAE